MKTLFYRRLWKVLRYLEPFRRVYSETDR